MPPKRSDLQHVTFHFYRSAVILSVPASTSIAALKSQLLPALLPFANIVDIPSSVQDIRLYEEKAAGEDVTKLFAIDEDVKNIHQWGRWKSVYLSFRKDGEFADPIYTLPEMDDDE